MVRPRRRAGGLACCGCGLGLCAFRACRKKAPVADAIIVGLPVVALTFTGTRRPSVSIGSPSKYVSAESWITSPLLATLIAALMDV